MLDELFNDPSSGAYVSGVVVVVEPVEFREGTTKSGSRFAFHSRRIQLQTKSGPVICSETRDHANEFRPIDLYDRVKWEIQRCRMDGSQMVFNVEP